MFDEYSKHLNIASHHRSLESIQQQMLECLDHLDLEGYDWKFRGL